MVTTRKYHDSNKFKKGCKCDLHNENKSKVLRKNFKNFNVFSRKCYRDMIEMTTERGIFTRKRIYVCQECLEIYVVR